MIPFGDDDPEDAWDASDPLLMRLAVLERWVPSIAAEAVSRGRTLRVRARITAALHAVQMLRRMAPPFHPLVDASLHMLWLRLLELRAWVDEG